MSTAKLDTETRSNTNKTKLVIDIAQKDIDAVNDRLEGMRKRLRGDILFIGARLWKMREKLPHGRWTRFIEATFPLSVKTANIWIRAWEGRGSELAVNDWDAYMRQLYGNEPKKLGAPSKDEDDEPEEKKGPKQHGKPGFEPGFGPEPEEFDRDAAEDVFEHKGKPGMYYFKKFVQVLDRLFLGSADYTAEAKKEFLTELIGYLEAQRLKL
jgi:hypothetical protein